MTYNYNRTASEIPLSDYLAKLKEFTELLEDPPEVEIENLPKDFKTTAKSLKQKTEKALRTAYHKASEAYYDLRDLKKLLDESAEAKK